MTKNKTEIHVTTVFDGELDATDAVSYTHLDVYKRQVLFSMYSMPPSCNCSCFAFTTEQERCV